MFPATCLLLVKNNVLSWKTSLKTSITVNEFRHTYVLLSWGTIQNVDVALLQCHASASAPAPQCDRGDLCSGGSAR